jgi:hypothetical protein
MEAGLAAQFPDIKTYRGIGIDDPTASLRLDYTPLGFHAQVLSVNGSFYIDPYYLNDVSGAYVSYYKRNVASADPWICAGALPPPDAGKAGDAFETKLNQIFDDSLSPGVMAPSITYAGTLKTYRAAVSANHQYSAAVGSGTVSGTQAAIVTAINRVTGVYETELGIRLTLIANNTSLIFTSASGDPWGANNGSWLNSATSTINGIVGSANYDIGHEFTTGSGGVAFLGVVGTNSKAGGTTGLPSPTGDAFYIDYVAHEMGHQFGANHTFNTAGDTSNRSASHAYEPGSGSTIMAYAGIEGNDDLQPHSDPYFHSDSIDAIRNFITNTIPSVGTATSTGDSAPTVSAGSNYVIPTGTPFALTATGSDPDGETVTYEWQERDLGAATLLNSADNGASPLFRDYVPSTSPTRYFPKLSSILAGSTTTAAPAGGAYVVERLPTLARAAMKFRVIARDNHLGGGGVSTSDMQIQVVNTGAAFLMSSFNSPATLNGGSTQTVTWNVAGTTGNGINVSGVKISYSTDGGQSFPYTLAASTDNDGSETITLPNVSTSAGRIKVEAVGNIFFDINNANLVVNAVTISSVPGAADLVAGSDTGSSSIDNLTRLNNADAGSVLSFDISGTVAGALVELYADGVLIGSATAAGTTTTITTDAATLLTDGPHSITSTQTQPGLTKSLGSSGLSIVVDSKPPTLVEHPDFRYLKGPQAAIYAFSEDVGPSIVPGDLAVVNITTSTPVPGGSISAKYDADSNVATFTFPSEGGGSGILDDGNYTATLSGIADPAGNPLADPAELDFFVLAGDANHDRVVNVDDLDLLAANWQGTDKTFAEGDFNYDGTVDSIDLGILSTRWQNLVPEPIVPMAQPSSTQAVVKPRSAVRRTDPLDAGGLLSDNAPIGVL